MAKARDGSKKKQISDALLREITSGDMSEGGSLPSVRTKHKRGSFIAAAAHGRTIGDVHNIP